MSNEAFLRARKAAGLSQVKLATKVGTSPTTIQLLEYGALMPSAEMAERVSRVLAVPVQKLFKKVRDE